MITGVSNNRKLAKQILAPATKKDEEYFFANDRITLSLNSSNGREEEGKKTSPVGKIEEPSVSIDQLIKEKQMELKYREGQLRTYEFFHKPIHKWNSIYIGGKELEDIHGGIKFIKYEIEKIKSELKDLILQKIKPSISTLPDEVVKYFKTVDFDIIPEELDKIGKIYSNLKENESPMKIKGNNIVTLEGSEIWQEMNRMLDLKEAPPKIEIDLQYQFLEDPHIYNKVKNAIKKGHKVRIMIDPGNGITHIKRLKYKDASGYYNCLQTLLTFQKEFEKGNFGICVAKKDNLTDTMHKELLRVGDRVLTGGINCNKGSGENASYAMLVEGPAAKTLIEGFKKNIEDSKGKTIEEIYGADLELLKEDDIMDEEDEDVKSTLLLKASDFMNFLILLLPQESQKYIEESSGKLDKVKRLMEECKKAGIKPEEYGDFYNVELNEDFLLGARSPFTANLINEKLYAGLTDKGKKVFIEKLEKSFKKMNSKENIKHLEDIKPPFGKDSGNQTMSVGDTHEELQALMTYAIESAEEFLYISAFSMNKDIAKLIINKQKEMSKEKKKIDIKVLLEPAKLPGDNIESYLLLNNEHIHVRWALLDGTGSGHDRKLNSKMMVSDKSILTGSADFTEKSLRENQETNVMAFIDPLSEESAGKREEYKKNFLDLWDKESLDLTLYGTASTWPVVTTREERHRDLLKKTVKDIERYEKSLGHTVKDMVNSKEEIKEEFEKLKGEGIDEGNARLIALKKFYTEEDMKVLRKSTGIVRSALP